ncbi:MAG: tetratricopeptide repeat protein [Roseibacillus sp.]
MNRKLIVHFCIFVAIVCVALIIWTGIEEPQTEPSPDEWKSAETADKVTIDPISGEPRIEGWKPTGSESGKLLVGIVLLIVVSSYGGIVFVAYLMPTVVHRFTHMFYGSDEEVESDPMHDARALFAQGDFENAIEAYRGVAAEQPEDRFPWVEISKIQHHNLESPDAAIKTLREALESFEWRVNDAAFFMFRLVELYEKEKQDLATSISILQQVVEIFPETRHAANAIHRLRELGEI